MLDSELDNKEFDDGERRGGQPGALSGNTTPLLEPPRVVFQPPVIAVGAPPDDGQSRQPATRRAGRGRSRPASPEDTGATAATHGSDMPANGDTSTVATTNGDTLGNVAGDGGVDEGTGPQGRRRRRRGGRGRGRARSDDTPDGEGAPGEVGDDDPAGMVEATSPIDAAGESTVGDRDDADRQATQPQQPSGPSDQSQPDAAGEPGDGDDEAATPPRSRRRRRKRRRSAGQDSDTPAPDDPPDTVVHVREPRLDDVDNGDADDVQSLKGSTRLEAKRQRRRENRQAGRRRAPILTEAEFLARREAVDRTMIVRRRGDHTQIAVLEDGILVEHYVDRASHQSYVGNVYLGRVQNVLPSMEAAFVDVGKGRNAVLYAGEVNFDASGLVGAGKRIESALKSGQSILVQVTKDPVGHKGARLTSQVSLPGRYLVYVPGAAMTGISRKLPDTERTRLKKILKKVMPEDAGIIVRTAAEGAAEEELARDVARLQAQWQEIQRKAKTATAPALLYSEPDLTIKVVRDVFNEDFNRLIVAGDDGFVEVEEYVKYVAPHLADRVVRWQHPGGRDVFAEYRVDEQLAKALDRKVWLPSGGSLVIDRTEAMTVIDVNTGRFTGQGGNLEETVTRNNLEAAEEIVRQLRLRDVGGIVVIDFIDMVLESNRELVLRRLLECLARDRTKHQVAEVTSLGLVQMTRKRIGSGLLESFSVPCECCNGRGVHVSLDPTELGHAGQACQQGQHGHGRRTRRPAQTGSRDGATWQDADRSPTPQGTDVDQVIPPAVETGSAAPTPEEAPPARAVALANGDPRPRTAPGGPTPAPEQATPATSADDGPRGTIW